MLAEKRSREKWSQDPRNTFWSRDRSKYGYRLLERMGWNEGRGLGVNEDGQSEPVRVSRKRDCLGVGARKGRDDNWIAQQNSYDQLLRELNATEGPDIDDATETRPLLSTAEQNKALLYRRFLQSKDLSMKSEEDMAGIFGRKRRKEEQPHLEGDGGEIGSHGVPTVKSSVTMQEYFAEKMRRLKESQDEKEAEEEEIEEDKVEKMYKKPSRMKKKDQAETKRRKRNRTRNRPNNK